MKRRVIKKGRSRAIHRAQLRLRRLMGAHDWHSIRNFWQWSRQHVAEGELRGAWLTPEQLATVEELAKDIEADVVAMLRAPRPGHTFIEIDMGRAIDWPEAPKL